MAFKRKATDDALETTIQDELLHIPSIFAYRTTV